MTTSVRFGFLALVIVGFAISCAAYGSGGVAELDLYGDTALSFSPLATTQSIGLDYICGPFDLGGELVLGLPPLALDAITFTADVDLADALTLGDLCGFALDADVSAKLSVLPAPLLNLSLTTKAEADEVSLTSTTKLRAALPWQFSGTQQLDLQYTMDRLTVQVDLDLALPTFEVDWLAASADVQVLDETFGLTLDALRLDVDAGIDVVAIPHDSWKSWLRVAGFLGPVDASSLTRLDATLPGIESQRFEMEWRALDVSLPICQSEMPFVAKTGFRASLLPTFSAESWIEMTGKPGDAEVAGTISAHADNLGLKSIQLLLEGEGEWMGESGSLEATAQLSKTAWSREGTCEFSVETRWTASTDPLLSPDCDFSIEVTADVNYAAGSLALGIGASVSFRTGLLNTRE